MGSIKVRLLGIGSAELQFDQVSIFIDAYNDFIDSPQLKQDDIVLFTHGDSDHFNAQKSISAVSAKRNNIIGPPSISYPLLAGTDFDHKLLKVIYPPHLKLPQEFEMEDISIKVFQTKHFIDWEPDHISYLLKFGGKKVYFTGDSCTFNYEDEDMKGIDILVYSLVKREVVEKKMESKDGCKYHAQELAQIQEKLKPKVIICNHLIDCDWTVETSDIKNEIDNQGMKNIIIPVSSKEEFMF